MAAPIGPGDYVECIANDSGGSRYAPGAKSIVKGDVCVVEAVFEWLGEPGLVIVGSHSDHYTRGFHARWFRPIYRRKEGAFDHMRAPPVRVPEKQAA